MTVGLAFMKCLRGSDIEYLTILFTHGYRVFGDTIFLLRDIEYSVILFTQGYKAFGDNFTSRYRLFGFYSGL